MTRTRPATRWRRGALALLTLCLAPAAAPQSDSPGVTAIVLGIAQDAGLPQANCRCPRCLAARRDPDRRRQVTALALHDAATRQTFLIDATPDFPAQLERLAQDPEVALPEGRTPLAGILLTHAHIGHYAGLIHLGREAMAASQLPLFASERMLHFLEHNAPWSELVAQGRVCPAPLALGERAQLTPRLSAQALRVPHRDELSDTVAFLIRGPRRSLLWLPDIDKWERWEMPLESILDEVDYAFLDGSFYSPDELPDRSLAEIPHPLIPETRARLRQLPQRRAQVFFIHLNHSNRLLDPAAPEHLELAFEGLAVAHEGLRLEL